MKSVLTGVTKNIGKRLILRAWQCSTVTSPFWIQFTWDRVLFTPFDKIQLAALNQQTASFQHAPVLRSENLSVLT
jgi:hypothetical protein